LVAPPKYLEEKLRKLRGARLENVLVCIDQERGCSDCELPKDAKIIRYRRHIDVRVLAVL